MDTVMETQFKPFWSFKDLTSKQFVSRIFFYVIILSCLTIGLVCAWNAAKWINKPFPGFLFTRSKTVGYTGQFHWTGIQAKLRDPDKIIRADGRPLSSAADLERIVTSTEIGESITYTVSRNGVIREVAIPTMRFTSIDLFLTFGIELLMGVLYLALGTTIFILKPDTRVSWVFLLLCSLIASCYLMSFDLESTHAGFINAYVFANSFVAAAFLHLSLLFPEKAGLVRKYRFLEIIPYLVSAVIFIPREFFYPQPIFYAADTINYVYMFLSVVALIASTTHSYFRSSSVLARQRAKVILFGTMLAFPIFTASLLILALEVERENISILANYTTLPVIIFPVAIAYAIAKHNLFDVDVYIKRAVGFGLMSILVASCYLLIQTMLDSLVMRPLFGEASAKVYPILFAVLVTFFFIPVSQRIQTAVGKLFFRKRFYYREAVISMSNALTSVLDLTEVMERIIRTVRKEMFIDTAGVILTEPQKGACRTFFIGEGTDQARDDIKEVNMLSDDPVLALVSREKKLITKYDIDEDPHYRGVREPCSRRFSEMGASVMIPLLYQGEVKGAFAVGHKKSGQFYSREDIDLLNTLASHFAVAIENARMAEQMKNEEIVRTNLARYLSPQIVDQVIKKNVNVNLGGDRKVVTVLFSDIRNFTTISESMPPDRLIHILNEYFTEMAGIIFENQGSLDKYIGDAIVAVFGSLIPLENSAKNAVDAAIIMMKRMTILSEKWLRDYGVRIEIGIGINTGEVFLGNVGSPERMEFTVIGDTVNVASRFSGLAKPGQILITKETLATLGIDVPCTELSPCEVKGKTGKVEVFELVC